MLQNWHFPKLLIVYVMAVLLLGCLQASATDVIVEELLLETDFAGEEPWPEKLDVEAGTAVQLTDEGYELSSASSSYVWSFSGNVYEDVELETAVRQLSPEPNNAYGLVCRAASSDSRNGYYFLISGDGLITIRREERGLSSPIVDWTPHNAVRQGERTNELRAICAGNYLAFYVNNQLVAEGNDDRFTQGLTGVAAIGSGDGAVRVSFEYLTIWAAEINRR